MHGTKSTRWQSWWLKDLVLATGFLTRLPMPPFDIGDRPLMRTAWSFPIIGAAIGGIAGLMLWTAQQFGLPALATSFVVIAATALLTGALHEDGLADLADGFGGGRDPESKIAIMRDSRIGAYGVLALILAAGLKASAISALITDGDTSPAIVALVAAHAAGRAAMVPVAFWLTPASDSGLGSSAGRPRPSVVTIALAGAALVLLIGLPVGTVIMTTLVGLLAAAAIAGLARRHIGGYTGDVLGAVEQTVETAILLALATAGA